MTPCCADHPDRCPMCKRPWDQPEDPDGMECWICDRVMVLREPRKPTRWRSLPGSMPGQVRRLTGRPLVERVRS